jgi:hypothetical protein
MWWTVPKGKHWQTTDSYEKDKESIEFIKEVFRTQGPFDGIIGFSQGGVLASILCGLRNTDPSTDHNNPLIFNFAIIVSAFPPSAADYLPLFEESKRHLLPPTLHIYGKGDTLVLPEYSKINVQRFHNPIVLEVRLEPTNRTNQSKHEGGHYIPVTSQAKTVFRDFLSKFLQE